MTDSTTLTKQHVDGSFIVSVDKRKHVGMGFSTQDLTLSIDRFSERYITPAAAQACPAGRFRPLRSLQARLELGRHGRSDP